jgi:hypothetical protein
MTPGRRGRHPKFADDASSDPIADTEDVANVCFDAVVPERDAAGNLYESRVDVKSLSRAPGGSLEHQAHIELPGDVSKIVRLVLERKGRRPRAHLKVLVDCQVVDDLLGEAVDEFLASWFGTQVPQRKHRDRRTIGAPCHRCLRQHRLTGSRLSVVSQRPLRQHDTDEDEHCCRGHRVFQRNH